MSATKPELLTRHQLARLMRRFYAGRITTWEFEDAVKLSDDPVVNEIFWQGPWTTYSDSPKYRFPDRKFLTKEDRRTIARWILFLQSDQPYVWPMTRKRTRWTGMWAPVVLFSGALVALFTQRWEWMTAAIFLLIEVARIRHNLQRPLISVREAQTVWPFANEKDFETARHHPLYFIGNHHLPHGRNS